MLWSSDTCGNNALDFPPWSSRLCSCLTALMCKLVLNSKNLWTFLFQDNIRDITDSLIEHCQEKKANESVNIQLSDQKIVNIVNDLFGAGKNTSIQNQSHPWFFCSSLSPELWFMQLAAVMSQRMIQLAIARSGEEQLNFYKLKSWKLWNQEPLAIQSPKGVCRNSNCETSSQETVAYCCLVLTIQSWDDKTTRDELELQFWV